MDEITPLKVSKRRLTSKQCKDEDLKRQRSVTERVVSKVWSRINHLPRTSQGTRESSGLSSVGTYRGSSVNAPSTSSTPRTSCEYEPIPPPRVETPPLNIGIQIMSEISEIDHGEKRTVWFAANVAAILPNVSSNSTFSPVDGIPPAIVPLDIAVIFDTSVYASKTSLDQSAKIIVHLSKLLSHPRDRIVIFCTAYRHANHNTITGCHLYPLSAPEPEKIAEELRAAIENRAVVSPKGLNLSETLSAAIRLFEVPVSKHFEAEERIRHILVISPNPAECCGKLPALSSIPVHIIQPGLVPWKTGNVAAARWSIPRSYTDILDPIIPASSTLLQDFVNHARANVLPQQVKDLKIMVEASPGMEVTGTIGDRNFATFHPGQVAFVLIKVKLPKIQPPEPTKIISGSSELMSDLEYVLGNIAVFHVKVSYRQPGEDQLVIVEKSCNLPRSNPTSIWSRKFTEISPEDQQKLGEDFFQRLIYGVANALKPVDALHALNGFLEKKYATPMLMDYLATVKCELNYRQSICRKYGIRHYVESTLTGADKPPPLITFAKPVLIKGDVSKDDLFVAPLKINKAPTQGTPSSTRTTIHRKEATQEGKDAAREIWQRMRSSAKSAQAKEQRSEENLRRVVSDEPFTEIKQRALKNKRSIGIDTLRSLSLQSQDLCQDVNAPWL